MDDDAYARDLTQRVLMEVGATVRTARSPQAAFELLDEFRPDIVLSDLGMPEEDGYEFVRKLRTHPGWKSKVPCVAVTALSRPEDRDQALAVGFDEHVGKPFDAGNLSLLIRQLTEKRQAQN